MQGAVAVYVSWCTVRLPFNCSICIAKYRLPKVIDAMKNVIHFRWQGLGKVRGGNEIIHVGLVPHDQAVEVLPDHFEAVVLVRDSYAVYLRILRVGQEARS